ncbi:MAG: hypothetical protein CMP57_02620 [Flavobacteriales bacterium]|nr:hypothetical protein [Flavobacteriales bacterium]|tara:strand:+ start:10208 stop:11710 length:1503 start_codon:yes stop_codon:yes gene_type:complete
MNKPQDIDVMIYALTGLSSLQIGLTGEVVKRIVNEGKDYRIVKCDSALYNCHFNQFHNVIACASCQSRMSFIHEKSGVQVGNILKMVRTKPDIKFPFFENYKEVLDFEYRDINIGRGVASSLISHYRNYNLSSHNRKEYIEFELRKSAIVVDNFLSFLKKFSPKEFIIFNGRFSEIHPLIEICKQKNISFSTIESGAKNKFEYYPNNLPHSIDNRNEKMHLLWKKADPNNREAIGHDWFKKKRQGDETYERSFKSDGAKNDLIPDLIEKGKENVLILNSSEDELKVIKEWQHGFYENQNDVIVELMKKYKGNNNYNFILRIHPNLKAVKNQQTQELATFNFPNLKIIKADVSLDTYSLIDQVDKVLVFGSLTGIESTYWGKPTVLFGKSFYYHLDVVHKPTNYAELFELIDQKELKPFPQENCLIYGHYFATYGHDLKWFVPRGKSESLFMGEKIPVFNVNAGINLFKYIGSFPLWNKAIKAAYKRKFNMSDILRYRMYN